MLQLDDATTIKERPVMTNTDNGQAPEQPPTLGPEIRPMEPNERIIWANEVDLCVQTFGRSVSYEPGSAPYSLRDLAEDAVGLLDAFGLESAHLVGMSMGGWIGQ